jgi:hypothetical protein
MGDSEYDQPSKLKQVGGAIAGMGTSIAVYGAEAYATYVVAEVIKAGFQSPDALISIPSTLCLLAIAAIGLIDLTQNSGEGIRSVVTSGVRAGIAVNQAILNK